MSNTTQTDVGAVVSLWRYPVKSMMGEEQDSSQVTERGLAGDRRYALLDRSDGKVATAKNPRKWPNLFAFRAALLGPLGKHAGMPPVTITLPDGTRVTSDQSDCDPLLSEALNREVTLEATEQSRPAGQISSGSVSREVNAEEYWPDLEGLPHRDVVTDFPLPAGTFFDCATVHLLTMATLRQLQDFYSQGRFEIQRFRPNIVVEPLASQKGFVEDTWAGHTLAIGDEVRLSITGPCGRCVMTTLAQGALPSDPGILRTAVQHNQGNVGIYAAVLRGGAIRRGDRVRLDA
jgi:MOSC domain-containing protein